MPQPNQPTQVTIAPDCRLQGELATLRDVLIEGHFSGSFNARGKLKIESGAEVTGKVEAGSFRLEPGGKITASVKIGVEQVPVSAPAKLAQALVPPMPINKGKIIRGLEEFAKFALGRK